MSTNQHQIVRFAVVGVGHIGRRHIEMISRNSMAKLVAICDVDEMRTQDYQHLCSIYDSIDLCLANQFNFHILSHIALFSHEVFSLLEE